MPLTSDQVKHILGDLEAHQVAEIIASGATVAELEEVAAHLAQEDDVMGEMERPLTGRAKVIYTMLERDAEQWDPDR